MFCVGPPVEVTVYGCPAANCAVVQPDQVSGLSSQATVTVAVARTLGSCWLGVTGPELRLRSIDCRPRGCLAIAAE